MNASSQGSASEAAASTASRSRCSPATAFQVAYAAALVGVVDLGVTVEATPRGDAEAATGAQDPHQVGERDAVVGEVADDEVGDHDVELAVGEREPGRGRRDPAETRVRRPGASSAADGSGATIWPSAPMAAAAACAATPVPAPTSSTCAPNDGATAATRSRASWA